MEVITHTHTNRRMPCRRPGQDSSTTYIVGQSGAPRLQLLKRGLRRGGVVGGKRGEPHIHRSASQTQLDPAANVRA